METLGSRRRLGRVLAALFLVPALAAAAPAAEPRDQALDLLRAGDTAAALPLLRAHAAEHPADAVMLYNLACAEAEAGTAAAAVAALRAALAAGFEDLDLLRTDPDLDVLRDDPGYTALLTEESSRLLLLARERGADLAEGRTTAPLPLHVREGDADAPEVRLRWLPLGLEVAIDAPAAWAGLAERDASSPWSGGPAVLVTLTAPGDARDYASENAWLLAFGTVQKRATGALYLPGQGRWQPVGELAPQLETDAAGRLRFRATIPWRTIRPFHPLVDPQLGLNAAIRVPGPGGGDLVAELLPDPARFAPAVPRRRAALLEFDAASTAAESFAGRVDDSVSRGGVLGLGFTAVVREAGRGSLAIDFLDGVGNSVLPGGARPVPVDLVAGVNRLERSADFSGLRTGSYQLRAELTFPAGARADWSTTILHLPPAWDEDLDARVAALPGRDRPTAAHLLGLLRGALDRHVPRRHPGAVATTLGRLTDLLERAERTGSVLPDAGAFFLVHEAGNGARVVEGVAAAEAAPGGDRLPVIVLAGAAGLESRLVQRIQRFDTGQPAGPAGPGPAPVYLVPRLPAADGDAADPAADLLWALDYFGARRALLVGMDGLAAEALALAARIPDGVAGVAIFAGRHVGPPDGLENLRTDLPVAWFEFPQETAAGGDAPRLREFLRGRLADGPDVQEVRGGLSLSQVADRTVLWARESATR